MPLLSQNKPADLIIGRGLLTAETIASELRARLATQLSRSARQYGQQGLIDLARSILAEFEPLLAESLLNTDLAAWIAGLNDVYSKIPTVNLLQFGGRWQPPGGPPRWTFPSLYGDDEPIVRFPMIEKAAENILQKRVATRDQFDRMADDAKARAFTVAGEQSADTLETIRDVLAEDIREGTSLRGFRQRLEERIDTSKLGPGHLENVYRTNTQAAFSNGHDELASHPIVAAIFPYQEYLATHDARCRTQHLMLEKLGISGTGIYRVDDPFWDVFTPPWDFQCLLPGTSMQGRFDLAARSRYSGEIVEIVTGAFNRLRVTVNHPVLTPHGFVAAGLLRKGDSVIRHFGQNYVRGDSFDSVDRTSVVHATYDPRRFSPYVNVQYAPTAAADVFASLALHRPLLSLPVCSDDLHGDAATRDGYIDVVGADWDLGDGLYSTREKFNEQLALKLSNDFSVFRTRACGSNRGPCFFGDSSPSSGLPGSAALSDDGSTITLESPPLRQLCIGSPAYFNASRYELPLESRTVAAGLAGQFLHRCSSAVGVDEIREIRRNNYYGHVYDFQAAGGWMVADGIIVSNCRCGRNLLSIRKAAEKGVLEAQEWLRTGRAPATPEHRLQFIPFRPPAGFVGPGRRIAA